MNTKICNKCKIEKDLKGFGINKNTKDGYQYQCKLCLKEYDKEASKKRYKFNKDSIDIKSKNYFISNPEYRGIYYEKNKEKLNIYSENWNINNPDKVKLNKVKNRESRNKITKERRVNDVLFKLKHNIRSSILNSLKRYGYTKNSRSHEILGCSFEEFKTYLESKFEPWMDWGNHGLYNGTYGYGWDIDHIIPLSSVTTEEELIKLNHFTNLQPLCSYTNRHIKKGNY